MQRMCDRGRLLELSTPLSAPQRLPVRLSALKKQDGKTRYGRLASAIALMGGCAIAFSGNRTLAQTNILPDNTLGAESSFVVPNFNGLPVEAIGGGAVRGQNLFHSFQEFNVSEDRGAYFFSPNADIQNILARVTGNNPSQILGTLGTFGNSTPNLFLINPNGISFGQDARLDVGGSLVASTANSVVFDNGYQFSATNPQAPPLLTVNVPLGLQFGPAPGRIVSQSVVGLAVQPGRTLGLVGGEVALEGGILFAPDGRIELGSVAGNSQVNLTPNSTGYTVGYEGVENFQDIRLTQGAIVLTDTNVGGGSIQVQGRNVTLTDGSVFSTATSGAAKAGNLIVNASDSVQVIGSSADGRPSSLLTSASSTATGEAGDITITTPTLLVKDGAFVTTTTFGAAKAGSLIINASQGVQVIGTGTFAVGQIGSNLSAIASGTGDAGDITITTPALLIGDGASVSTGTLGAGKGGNLTITTGQLLVRDGAFINADTAGVGKGGNVIVNASQGVQVIGRSADNKLGSNISANTSGTSDAGTLTITTPVLLVRDGALVNASTLGAGKGGSLIINASDSVQLVGGSLSAFTSGTGYGGEIRITTGQLLVRDGASIDAGTLAAGKGGSLVVHASDWVQLVGGDLSAFTAGTGDGGEIRITTGQLLLKDGAEIFVGTLGAGKGGSVTIDASDWVGVIGESADARFSSKLSATTSGTGDGGEIRITTGQLLVRDGAGIFAATVGAGKGGNLTVNASDSVQVIGESADGRFNSKLTTQAEETGDAGNLTITTGRLLIKDGAQVTTGTFGAGKGGRLIVNASESVQVIGGSAADSKFGSALGAQTEGTGDAGDMSITTARLLISDGAFVTTGTGGAGKGGDLTVNASESVQVIGTSADGEFPSLLSVRARATSGSTAGNLTVQTRQMSVRDGAEVTVSSPSGQAGNMTITANSLHLNQGKVTAVTGTSGAEGGANITLQGLDLLRMDNESLISASALEDANGGNVTIDSTFIVATPPKGPEGSDITANAVRGNGGRVRITTQGLFGIKFRPQRTPKNDITVSSDFGLAGVFEQNTPGVDPSRGLGDLPTDVVDGTRLIDNRCTPAGATQRSNFVITGRGGLPPSPTDPLQGESVITNWVTLDSQEENTNTVPIANPTRTTPKQLVEAQSWVFGADGQVILTAQSPTVTPYQSWQTLPSCHDLKPSSN